MNKEASELLASIHRKEAAHGMGAITNEILQNIADDIYRLYRHTFGVGRNIQLAIVPPELVPQYMGTDVNPNVPRGYYVRGVEVMLSPDKKKVTNVKASDTEVVLLANGDPGVINNVNSRGVFRHILAHEYCHSQVEMRSLLDPASQALHPRDIRYGGQLHYVQGFKAVSYNISWNQNSAVTIPLEEYTAQYIAMHMHDALEKKDGVLEDMKKHGLGIKSNTIAGAEIMHQIIKVTGIDPLAVEELHRKSDIKGLLAEFDCADKDLSRAIVKASTATDFATSLKSLETALHNIQGRS